jgi:hypothetical protein
MRVLSLLFLALAILAVSTVSANSAACARAGGSCSYSCSGGSFRSGLCPGGASYRCCVKSAPAPSGGQSASCSRIGGSCSYSCSGGTFHSGLCPGGAGYKCCVRGGGGGGSGGGDCGYYGTAGRMSIAGNGGTAYTVVKIAQAHLTNPASYNQGVNSADNTITVPTGCAFNKMRNAAAGAGVSLKISSGFRTLAMQNYFWHCYKTRSCNNGNLAAVPGTSKHGSGIALDLAISGNQYAWLAAHAHQYGFIRTVTSERWHFEYRPGQGRPSWY